MEEIPRPITLHLTRCVLNFSYTLWGVVEILPCVKHDYLVFIVNIMGADVLVTQGASASASMILIMSKRNYVKFGPRTSRIKIKLEDSLEGRTYPNYTHR